MDPFGRDEEQAFEDAFQAYFAILVAFVQKYLIKDRHTAETIVIDAFLDIRKKKQHSFRKDGILSLLFTAVKRDCIDYLLRQNKEDEKQREFEQWVFDQPFDTEDPLNDPQVVESELFQKLRNGLEQLPLTQKEIMEALLDGNKAKDIARQRGIKDNTVSITKKNSIKNLQRFMGRNDTTILLILNFLLNEHLKN